MNDNESTQGAKSQAGKPKFERVLGLFPATAINMTQMVGIGPFITIPVILTTMGGPQAMLGWILGAVLAMADGQIWAELGAAMPSSGGSYVYLREAFQYRTGKLIPFLFVWTTLLATPLTMSTGMIGISNYISYFVPGLTQLELHFIAVGFTIITVALLYRRIGAIAQITKFLWVGMIITILMIVTAGLTHFNPHLAFDFPTNAFSLTPQFFIGLGAGMGVSIYDYLGYYSTAYMGDEIKRPGRVIPLSIIISILAVAVIDLSVNIVTVGVVPWKEAAKSVTIGSLVLQRTWGSTAAIIMTVLIIITAFASGYTGLLAGSRLPYNAAKDGLFFKPFGALHKRMSFPHISLLAIGLITAIGCFFTLTTIINTLVTASILVQFIGQIAALTILRARQPKLHRPYHQFLYPLCSFVALVGWLYIFFTSPSPAIPLAVGWVLLGGVAYLIWSYFEKVWPFRPIEVHEAFLNAEAQDGELEVPAELSSAD
jgi:amino acid transporter